MKTRRWYVLGSLGVVAAAVVALAVGGIGENLVYYWGPSEVRAAGPEAVGATIRLGGKVADRSVTRGRGSQLDFDVTDGRHAVHVRSTGVPPQMFREGIGVVVEGTMTAAGHFQARRLLVSHSNEYRAPQDGAQVDTRALMKTTADEPEQAQ